MLLELQGYVAFCCAVFVADKYLIACRCGDSPVSVAARHGHTDCVSALVASKADILICNS